MKNNTKLVKCKICGKSFATLGFHIKKTHKLTKQQYLNQYPNSQLMSESYRKNLSKTIKSRFVDNPELRIGVASRRFDFVSNDKLKSLLSRDYKSANFCLSNKQWKPAIILYGSIIEAILREETSMKTFETALVQAQKDEIITDREYHQLHIVRDSRNYVHLHKELEEGEGIEIINEYWAKSVSSICEAVIDRLRKSNRN